jgi:hypothetical protein
MASPDLEWRSRFELIARAAAAVKTRPADFSISASWTDRHDWETGISAAKDGVTVFYGPASETLEDIGEAIRLLQEIFTDEIVCVTALEREIPVQHALARHTDPTASFNRLNRSAMSRDMPAIDHVTIRSWSGKHDRE